MLSSIQNKISQNMAEMRQSNAKVRRLKKMNVHLRAVSKLLKKENPPVKLSIALASEGFVGNKVGAIKAVRHLTGMGLLESKNLVECQNRYYQKLKFPYTFMTCRDQAEVIDVLGALKAFGMDVIAV